MDSAPLARPAARAVTSPRFAALYERMARGRAMRSFLDPLRAATAGQARGVVLEVGAGTGLSFALYEPGQVERVEAIEPSAAMLRYARTRLATARVPVTLTQAPTEALPFSEAVFDSAVATMVFCSVSDPARGLREIHRVLKPGGTLLLAEHVRAEGAFLAGVQDALVPLTTRLFGNCHWNRDTAGAVASVGFQVEHLRHEGGGLHPMIVLRATKSPRR
jgi:ubiquinone/menaquinone biosynthesis C-methylase UbiE